MSDSTDIARLGWLLKAKRSADEASEALRRMIEHDLAITIPTAHRRQAARCTTESR